MAKMPSHAIQANYRRFMMIIPNWTVLRTLVIISLSFTAVGTTSVAQQNAEPTLGVVTNLPLPRFVSLKSTKANVRRGPSQAYQIDWIFVHRGTPLQITAEFNNWRRISDQDNVGGWIHYSLISGHRTVVIQNEQVNLLATSTPTSRTVAIAEKGVIASLGSCTLDWCQIETGGFDGWVPKSDIWGVGPEELRE